MIRVFTRLPDGFRRALDDDRRMIRIAFVLIGGLAVGGIVIDAETRQAQLKATKLSAIHESETKTTYQQCVASIKPLGKFRDHVSGVNDFTVATEHFGGATEDFAGAVSDLADVLSQNSAYSIENAPPDDPLQPTRRTNLQRLVGAESGIAAGRQEMSVARQEMSVARAKVAAVTTFPVPTEAICAARRDALARASG